jgi:uncharacterized membrane protein SpoIIM required for sporulation
MLNVLNLGSFVAQAGARVPKNKFALQLMPHALFNVPFGDLHVEAFN